MSAIARTNTQRGPDDSAGVLEGAIRDILRDVFAPQPVERDDPLTSDPERIVWTRNEAAAQLKSTSATLSRLFHRGEIGGYQIGKRIYFTQADVDEFVRRGRASSPAAKTAEPAPTHMHVVRRTG